MRIEKPIGQYSETQARNNLKKGIPIVLISYAVLLVITLDYLPFYINLGKLTAPVAFITGMAFMFGLMQFIAQYQHWKMGLNGEKKVIENISKKLGYEHALFNDVMLKDGKRLGNIDHIIVGPRGIFVIETKHIHGKITVNGDIWNGVRGNPSQQAKNHARRLYNLVNYSRIFDGEIPYVKPIVVLSSKKTELLIEKSPERCKIIQIKEVTDNALYAYIMENDVLFSTREIELIIELLKSKIA
jgi:hypothetical protein